MPELPLRAKDGTIRAWTQVDHEDFIWLRAWTWRMDAGGYAVRCERPGGGKLIHHRMHREILDLPAEYDGREVDHIDGDVRNNRRSNLRVCTHAENMQNVRKNPERSSRYRNVSWHRRIGKWQARVTVQGSLHHLGFFEDEDEAGRATEQFRVQHLPFTRENALERAA